MITTRQNSFPHLQIQTGALNSTNLAIGNMLRLSTCYSGCDPVFDARLLHGTLGPHNARLFSSSSVLKRFISGDFIDASNIDIAADLRSAFDIPHSITLPKSGHLKGHAEHMIEEITAAARMHAGVRLLLALMKEQIGSHYYHSLRTGVAHAGLMHVFDPSNNINHHTLLLVGILHDVGKLEVREEILFKHGALDIEESAEMRMHNEATKRILTPFSSELPEIAEIAVCHHPYPRYEWNGKNGDRRSAREFSSLCAATGMDRRRKDGKRPELEIKRAGALLRLADTYDALGSEREYKEAMTGKETRKTMASLFPHLVSLNEYLLETFPCRK